MRSLAYLKSPSVGFDATQFKTAGEFTSEQRQWYDEGESKQRCEREDQGPDDQQQARQ